MREWSIKDIEYYARRNKSFLHGLPCSNFGKLCDEKTGECCKVGDFRETGSWIPRDISEGLRQTNYWMYVDHEAVLRYGESGTLEDGSRFLCYKCNQYLEER